MVARRSNHDLEWIELPWTQTQGEVHTFEGTYTPRRPGSYVYGVRVVARHPSFANPHEVAFVRWA